LGCNAHRAGVLVALAHHDATHGDKWPGCKAHFLGTQQRGYDNITASF